MLRTNAERLKRIQDKLGVEADGKLGPQTLTALEKKIFGRAGPTAEDPGGPPLGQPQLTVSRQGVEAIIGYEVSSRAYYESRLTRPTWPGGDSGVTIGIGYDLGYITVRQFDADWSALLGIYARRRLRRCCGVKGSSAKRYLSRLQRIAISFEAAQQVFIHQSLPGYAGKTLKAYPGVERLFPDAQAALLSLIYNRGASMTGASRREMANIRSLVAARDYQGIATQIISMKRLWQNRGLDGLLRRRDEEARMVANANRHYDQQDLIVI